MQDKMLKEKMTKQKIINSSLELLLNFAEDTVANAEEEVKSVGYTIEDYESEGCIVPPEYRERYANLRKQLNIPLEYMDERNSD